MLTTRRTITRDGDLAARLQHLTQSDLSRLLNHALHLYLQRLAVEALEAEFTHEVGPIPAEIQAEVAAFDWPR